MFIDVKTFNQELYGAVWVESKTTKVFMFQVSLGWINSKENMHTRTHFGYHGHSQRQRLRLYLLLKNTYTVDMSSDDNCVSGDHGVGEWDVSKSTD